MNGRCYENRQFTSIQKSMLDLAFVWYEEYLIVMQISEGVFHLADKTLFHLHNSLYDTQPHLIIIGFTKWGNSHYMYFQCLHRIWRRG